MKRYEMKQRYVTHEELEEFRREQKYLLRSFIDFEVASALAGVLSVLE